jgi:hypothetical protein
MKRRNSARLRSPAFSLEDALFIGLGVLGGMASNGAVAKVTANMSPNIQEATKKYLPYAKVGVGGAGLMAKKLDRRARMASAGFGAVGVVETAENLAPQYFSLGSGETYRVLGMGNTDLSRTPIPVTMSGGYDYMDDEPSILGMDNHSEVLADL